MLLKQLEMQANKLAHIYMSFEDEKFLNSCIAFIFALLPILIIIINLLFGSEIAELNYVLVPICLVVAAFISLRNKQIQRSRNIALIRMYDVMTVSGGAGLRLKLDVYKASEDRIPTARFILVPNNDESSAIKFKDDDLKDAIKEWAKYQ